MLRSLKTKMIIPIVGILFFTVIIILWVVMVEVGELADWFVDRRVNLTSEAVTARLADFEEKSRLVALSVASDYAIMSYLQDWNAHVDRDAARAAMLARTQTLADELGVDSFVIRDNEGLIVLRLHEPDIYGDFGDTGAPGLAAFEGATITAFTSTPTLPLGLTTSTPVVFNRLDGECPIIGTMTAIYMFNNEEFVDTFAEIFDARITVFVDGTSIMTSAVWPDGTVAPDGTVLPPGSRAVSFPLSPGAYEALLVRDKDYWREDISGFFEGNYIGYFLSLRGHGGEVVGVIVVAFSNDAAIAATEQIQNTIIGVGAIGLILCAAVMFLLIARLLRPLEILHHNVKKGAAEGLVTLKVPNDEVGTIAREVQAIMQRERDSGEQLILMLDAAPFAITLYDKNLNSVMFNREAIEMFSGGRTSKHEEIEVTMPLFQPDGRNSVDVFNTAVENALKNGIYQEEIICLRQDGAVFPADVTWASVPYRGENVVIEYVRDITEIKAAEKKEREAEERSKLLLNSAPVACFLLNSKFKTIWCNSVAAELFVVKKGESLEFGGEGCDFTCETCRIRLDVEECIARKYLTENIAEIFPGHEKDPEQIMRFIADACLRASREGELVMELEYVNLHGESFPCETRIQPVIYHESLAFAIYVRDLREIKSAIERAHEANALNETILRVSPYIINIWSDSYELISTSPQSVEMFGLESEQQYIDLFPKLSPEYQPCGTPSGEMIISLLNEALSRDGHVKFEWMHQTLTGEPVPSDVTLARVRRHGQYFVLAYTVDLRPIKAAAEESNRAKSKFLARMSHEIRTPLAAVIGISEIELHAAGLVPRVEESFAKIHSSANLLLGIVNDILDLSKIEAGKMELSQDEYLVQSMIIDIAHLHLVYLNSKDIKFVLVVDENLPVCLLGDSLRIKQIVNNLLSNAFKYTKEGTVELSLRCSKNETEGYVTLEISVRDTGLGMTAEQLDILQNSEYTRFHEHENRFIGGTGLGLPIVNNFLQLMDARMKMESEPGKGTNVMVFIPQKVADSKIIGKETAARLGEFDEVILSSARQYDVTPEPMPYGKVLVVDDVDANLHVSRGLLSFYDLTVETCCSGQGALDKVKKGEVYDIIFLDEMMPGLSGTETLRALREMDYTEPIVALTANAIIGQAEEYLRAGFDGFISKPIQAKTLNMTLNKFVRAKQPAEVIHAALMSRKKLKTVDDMELYQDDLAVGLRPRFARSHKNTFEDFTRNLYAGNVDAAYRIAHTLKSSSSLIREYALSEVAREVEAMLRKREIPADELLHTLEAELRRTLDSIENQADAAPATPATPPDKEKAAALYEKIAPLLKAHNTRCLDYLDELRAIPEAEELVRCIEDFNFIGAKKVFDKILRK